MSYSGMLSDSMATLPDDSLVDYGTHTHLQHTSGESEHGSVQSTGSLDSDTPLSQVVLGAKGTGQDPQGDKHVPDGITRRQGQQSSENSGRDSDASWDSDAPLGLFTTRLATTDSYMKDVQKLILQTPGGILITDCVYRFHQHRHIDESQVIAAMTALSSGRDSSAYIGEFKTIRPHASVFFKCHPSLVKESALEQYGILCKDYDETYFQDTLLSFSKKSKLKSSREKVVMMCMQYFPYDLTLFPLEAMNLNSKAQKAMRTKLRKMKKTG